MRWIFADADDDVARRECQDTTTPENRLSDFNVALPKPVGNATPVATRDDLTELKESQALDVCRTANIMGGKVAKILGEKLTKRNLAAIRQA